MIARRRQRPELLLRAQRVVEDLHRHRRVAVAENGVGSKVTKAAAPTSSSGAVSPSARETREDRRRSRSRGSRPAAPAVRIVCHWVAPSASEPSRIEAGTARIASRAAMITIGSTSSARVSAAGSEDEAEVERAADDEGEPEDAVDDRGHRGEVLDVELDQPVPPAAPCRRTPRGRSAAPTPIGTMNRITPAISSSEPMIAGRKPAVSGDAIEGGVGEQVDAERRGALDEGLDEQRDQARQGDQRPRAAAAPRRPCCGSRRRAAGRAASPASSPGRRRPRGGCAALPRPARPSLVDLAVPADEPDRDHVHHQGHHEEQRCRPRRSSCSRSSRSGCRRSRCRR